MPYFFLVSLGALQSIPAELVEAARVDGGGAWQVFRRVTLPLLLVAVAPLMIASFAFNFNNFGNIYLLTGGGPPANDQSVAGATDILITYTYKLAFAAGKGSDYGARERGVDHHLLHRRGDLRRRVLAHEGAGGRCDEPPPIDTPSGVASRAAQTKRRAPPRPSCRETGGATSSRMRRDRRSRSSRSRTSSRPRSTRDRRWAAPA